MYHSEYMSSLYRNRVVYVLRPLVFVNTPNRTYPDQEFRNVLDRVDVQVSKRIRVSQDQKVLLHVPPHATANNKPSKKARHEQLSNYMNLGMSDADLNRFLRSYLLRPEQMSMLGYPVECVSYPEYAIIFKSPIETPSYLKSAKKYNKSERTRVSDLNARDFVPNSYRNRVIEAAGSEKCEKFEGVCVERAVNFDGICRKTCVRCDLEFYMTSNNTYITQDACIYHWGKLIKVFGENRDGIYREYTCCRGKQTSRGCTQGKLHVWNGVISGLNGPFKNFVKTRPKKTRSVDGNYGVYAIDCEMCYTGHGLELAKISVIAIDGRPVYDVYVKPENEIVDYNTRFSGITAKDLKEKRGRRLKSLREVQSDLLEFISAETILIGHSLESDLRVLRIVHSTVIDTAVCFPHHKGLPYKRSLKSLTSCFLSREIQVGSNGHDSSEDAKACVDLMLWRVSKDFGSTLND